MVTNKTCSISLQQSPTTHPIQYIVIVNQLIKLFVVVYPEKYTHTPTHGDSTFTFLRLATVYL